MSITYHVSSGVARKDGQESHKVLFRDLIHDFEKSVAYKTINRQSKKDGSNEKKLGLLVAGLLMLFVAYGVYSAFQQDPSTLLVVSMFHMIVGMIPALLLWVLISSFMKSEVDKDLVEVYLYQNDKVIKQFYRDFINSINKKEQPRLAGCNDENIEGIYTIYDLKRGHWLDNRFDIIGYYNVDDSTVKVNLNVRVDSNYERAFVREYTISCL